MSELFAGNNAPRQRVVVWDARPKFWFPYLRLTERLLRMGQTRGIRQQHGWVEKLVSTHGLIILLGIVVFAVSIVFFRAAVREAGLTLASQVDREDAELCIKFGFAAGTARHDACKLDLLDLRRSHEQLAARTSLP